MIVNVNLCWSKIDSGSHAIEVASLSLLLVSEDVEVTAEAVVNESV